MKTLIVGGTGMIGGYIALRMHEAGHEVTLAARNPAPAETPLTNFPILRGSYIEEDFTKGDLEGFEALVFAAAKDPRQAPRGVDKAVVDEFYRRANSVGVPRFGALAKAAGVRTCAHVGTFIPQAKPELVEATGYVRSRLDADEGLRALADERFHVVSLNAPPVVGFIPGLVPAFPVNYKALAEWALGRGRDLPRQAASGGVNFISVESLCQAVVGGLNGGENGRGYLVGDENLHFGEFFSLFFKAAGAPAEFVVRDEPMPMMSDAMLVAGRNGTIFYEPEGVKELGYAQNDIARTVREIVDYVR
jgi:nucleoside-diphosphate-sugar epimerase